MRRYGPEVVDLAFKMRCFGDFGTKNCKKLCFSLLKQQIEHADAAQWRRQFGVPAEGVREPWNQARRVQEEEGEVEESSAEARGEPSKREVEVAVEVETAGT